MINNKKAKELQCAIKTIIKYCDSHKQCNKNCVFYKDRIGCSIGLPLDNWDCQYFLHLNFKE